MEAIDLADYGTIKNVTFEGLRYTAPSAFLAGGLSWKIKTVEFVVKRKQVKRFLGLFKRGTGIFFFWDIEVKNKRFEAVLCEANIELLLCDVNSGKFVCRVDGWANIEIAALRHYVN